VQFKVFSSSLKRAIQSGVGVKPYLFQDHRYHNDEFEVQWLFIMYASFLGDQPLSPKLAVYVGNFA